MIIITRIDITDEELDHIRERVEAAGLHTHLSRGERRTIIGCIGDEAKLAEVPLKSLAGVESVMPVLKPYKLASKEFAANIAPSSAASATKAASPKSHCAPSQASSRSCQCSSRTSLRRASSW